MTDVGFHSPETLPLLPDPLFLLQHPPPPPPVNRNGYLKQQKQTTTTTKKQSHLAFYLLAEFFTLSVVPISLH